VPFGHNYLAEFWQSKSPDQTLFLVLCNYKPVVNSTGILSLRDRIWSFVGESPGQRAFLENLQKSLDRFRPFQYCDGCSASATQKRMATERGGPSSLPYGMVLDTDRNRNKRCTYASTPGRDSRTVQTLWGLFGATKPRKKRLAYHHRNSGTHNRANRNVDCRKNALRLGGSNQTLNKEK
jgi:hypothetical protein